MIDELTEKINSAVCEQVFNKDNKIENEVDLTHTTVDESEYEATKKSINELLDKLVEHERWVHEQQMKCKPGIIIDSQGHYVGACGTASFLDYCKAFENGQVLIKDHNYKNNLSKILRRERRKRYL